MKIKLIPFDKLEIITSKSPNELLEILKNHVEQKKLFRAERVRKYFHGDVFEGGFRISTVNNFGISLLPGIYGDYFTNKDKTKIVIRFNPNLLVTLFIGAWIAPQILFLFIFLIGALISNEPQYLAMLIMLGGILFGWGFALIIFWPEVNKQKEMIIGLFKSFDSNIKVIEK